MTLLSQVLSNAKEAVKAQGRSTVSGVRAQVDSEISRVVNTGRSAVVGGVSAGLAGAVSAGKAAIVGDFEGAASAIMSTPSEMLGAMISPITSTVQSTAALLGSWNLSGGSILGTESMLASSLPSPVTPGNALAGLLARPDPLMAFSWYVELPTIQGPGLAPANLPWYYVEEATVPFRNFEPRAVYRDGRNRNYAGKYNVDPITLGVYLDENGTALSYWDTWSSAIVAPFDRANYKTQGGGFRPPRSYQKDVRLYLLDVSKRQVVRFTCVECWPQNTDGLALQSQTNDRLVGRITLNVGDVFTEVFSIGDLRWPGSRVTDNKPIGSSPTPGPGNNYDLNRGLPVPSPATIGQQAQAFPVEL